MIHGAFVQYILDEDVRWWFEGKRNVPRMDGVTNDLKLLAEAASEAARLTRVK